MSQKLKITPDQVAQMEQLTGNHVVETLEPGYKYRVQVKKSGKTEVWYSDKIISRINFELKKIQKQEEAEKGLSFNSLFANSGKKQIKQFKTLGTNVEVELYEQFKTLAKKHNMSVHTLIKRMIIQLLEADKLGKF